MNNEEFDKMCEELRAQGLNDKDILGAILEAYKQEKIELDDLKKLAGALGYELSEKALAEAGEGQSELPAEDASDVTEEDVEEAQEVDGDDSEDDAEGGDGEDYEEDADVDEEEEIDEEDEKKNAKKWFGLD